jgi:nucleoid-associated protein YgaU
MKVTSVVLVTLAALLVLGLGTAVAQEMTKEQWQAEITKLTAERDALKTKSAALDAQIAALKTQSSSLDEEYTKELDALYALVGSDASKAAAYRSEIEAAEATANELARLSDADLMARSADVEALAKKKAELWENKLSLIPEFWDRLTALNEKIASIQNALAAQVKVYTVGTWQRDRDCLWNIAKKKDIYANAWLWPKIWQGNRDQIKDPDVIKTGWKLKIPKGNELNAEEKGAARKYYAKKAAAAPAPPPAPAQAPAAK